MVEEEAVVEPEPEVEDEADSDFDLDAELQALLDKEVILSVDSEEEGMAIAGGLLAVGVVGVAVAVAVNSSDATNEEEVVEEVVVVETREEKLIRQLKEYNR